MSDLLRSVVKAVPGFRGYQHRGSTEEPVSDRLCEFDGRFHSYGVLALSGCLCARRYRLYRSRTRE